MPSSFERLQAGLSLQSDWS